MKKLYILALLIFTAFAADAEFEVEWDKIVHWTGEGPNRAALIVQFNDNGANEAYVWGYRWRDGEKPSGETMFREIAGNSTDLDMFTQYTGWMGNTICGIGYSRNHSVMFFIGFDFDGARQDKRIAFDYFTANESLGQTSVPGDGTPALCQSAISEAQATHILDHPVNARDYGYACYDYDYWQPGGLPDGGRWHAGWYNGYWAYFTGGVKSSSLSYSGIGMTSRELENDNVDAWCYRYFATGNDDVDGYTGATDAVPSYPLNYAHFSNISGSISIEDGSDCDDLCDVYTLTGSVIAENVRPGSISLTPGIYIVRQGGTAKKIYIR